ncbi:MAG TPA: acyloxyacyl hydrolase [Burkholderiales bacterium]|nr:acyloxyacyl hydrolase [Burkholderiales bacterium]
MNRQNVIGAALLAGALYAASTPAFAIDGFAAEGARSTDDDVNRAGLALSWDWGKPLLRISSDWHLGGFWEASLSQWHKSDVGPGQNDNITDVGFTPVFRIQPNSLVGPYLEAGIGLHLQSHTSIGSKNMSTAFQFGDHIGFGYRFGAKSAFDLNYRFQHHSNASIKRPNPGINFHEVRLLYHF